MKNNTLVSILVLIIILALAAVFFTKGKDFNPFVSSSREKTSQNSNFKPKEVMTVYFLKDNMQKTPHLVGAQIQADVTNHSSDSYSLMLLFSGVSDEEKEKGLYSEIPKGTKLLSVEDKKTHYVVNLSQEFESGGGALSMQLRLEQLVKTIESNFDKPVYLEIEGVPKKTFGGEGIEITQPIKPSL